MVWKLFYLLTTRIFDVMTFPSNFIRNEALEFSRDIKGISYVLRNPLIQVREKDGHLETQGDDLVYIGNAGWLIKRKRWDIFLECCANAIKKSPNVRVIIAGDGPERKNLELMAERLSITDKIIWTGWVKNLTSFYNKIDILLFNSDADAFPTTPIEAMAYGIPIVASCLWGGMSEAIPDRRYGMLIAEHNVVQLSDYLVKLVLDEKYRRETGQCGREYINRLCEERNISAMLMKTFMNKQKSLQRASLDHPSIQPAPSGRAITPLKRESPTMPLPILA
jgi:glycosyltransferase involved in cell wall biosynthesis